MSSLILLRWTVGWCGLVLLALFVSFLTSIWGILSVNSRGSVVGIVTKLRPGLSGFQMPAVARDFRLIQSIRTGSGAHQAFCSIGTEVFPGDKMSGASY
jgi:hypothetical protein